MLSISTQLSQNSDNKIIILDQAVLIHPFKHDNTTQNTHILGAIGIPDLIRISSQSSTIVWEVGEIKNSRKPRYYQKWQVAFYAYLLTQLKSNWIRSNVIDFPVEISTQGLLMMSNIENPVTCDASDKENWQSLLHFFDLSPFFSNFPVLIQ